MSLIAAEVPAGTAGRRLLRRAARFVFRSYTTDLLARSIADPPPEPPEDTGLVLHRLTSPADVAERTPTLPHGQFDDLEVRLPWLNPLRRARWRREVAGRFRRGDVGYVATVDGEIASWIWMSSRPDIRQAGSGLHIHLAPGDVYLYHFWAVPRHRHLGTARFVMSGVLRDLHDADSGVEPRPDGRNPQVFGFIDRPNPPNLLLLTVGFGFRMVQTVHYIRLLYTVTFQVPWSATPPDGPCSRNGRPLAARPVPAGVADERHHG
jgi:hypothetical protein